MSNMFDTKPRTELQIAKCLRRLRKLLNETTAMTAEACDVPENNIINWENAKFTKDTAIYVNYIYEQTMKYGGHTVPEYFKNYWASDEIQERLKYYKTIGYAFWYMRKRVMNKGVEAMAKEAAIHYQVILDIEHNVYVGIDKLRRYANYIYTKTGTKCNHKVLKIANELYLK